MVPSIATPHQLADRAVLSGIMRVFDLIFLGVVVMAARFLGKEGFGLFIFGLTLATVMVSPLLEAFVPLVTKDAARHPASVGTTVGTVIPCQLVLMFGFVLIGWASMHLLHWPMGRQHIVLTMTFALGLRAPLEVLRGAVRGLGRFDLELVTIVVERCAILASAVATLWLGGGPLSLTMCFIGTRLLGVVVAFQLLQRIGHPLRWHWQGWSRLLAEAMPYSLTKWLYSGYDQASLLCLALLWNDAVAGTYSAAWRLVDGASTIPQILVFVLLPELSARHGLASTKVAPLVRQTTSYVAMIALVLAAVFVIEGPWMIKVIYGSGYAATVMPFQILAVGILFAFTTEIARVALWAIDRQRTALAVMGAGLAVNVGCNLLLIPRYGALGAAMATVVSGVTVALMMWRVLARIGIHWPWRGATLKPALVALAISGVLWSLQTMPWPVRVMGGVLTVLVALFATKAMTPAEWALLWSLPGRLIPRASR